MADKFEQEFRKIKKIMQEAVDNIDWEQHGFKKTGTLNRQTGVRLLSKHNDFQMFVELYGTSNIDS